jgi:hypothetical protein
VLDTVLTKISEIDDAYAGKTLASVWPDALGYTLFLVQTSVYNPANYRGKAGDFFGGAYSGAYKCGLVLVPEERSCPAAPCARPSMVALLSCFWCFKCSYGILFATAYCLSRIFIPSISASSACGFGCKFHAKCRANNDPSVTETL